MRARDMAWLDGALVVRFPGAMLRVTLLTEEEWCP